MTPPSHPDDAAIEKKPAIAAQSFEGDYRPSSEAPLVAGSIRVDPLQTEFLMRLANALNTTLDLQTLLHRTADLVRAVIDYRIFAILLLNERTNDLRMRFQIGHSPETERLRIRVGKGVVAGPRIAANPFWCRMCAWKRTTSAPTPRSARNWRCR